MLLYLTLVSKSNYVVEFFMPERAEVVRVTATSRYSPEAVKAQIAQILAEHPDPEPSKTEGEEGISTDNLFMQAQGVVRLLIPWSNAK